MWARLKPWIEDGIPIKDENSVSFSGSIRVSWDRFGIKIYKLGASLRFFEIRTTNYI